MAVNVTDGLIVRYKVSDKKGKLGINGGEKGRHKCRLDSLTPGASHTKMVIIM